jgi:hypothetical protein
MKKLVSIIALSHAIMLLYARDGDYAISKISPELLKNADAVLRSENLKTEINSPKEFVFRHHYVVTILNENGDKWAEFAEYYDKLRDIDFAEGFLYDASGKQLKKMKYKDLQDVSGVEDNSLMDDNRVKRYNFYYKGYPYTVEYDVVIRCKHTFYFPAWVPQPDEKLSVEHSQVSIICPQDYNFRYKSFGYDREPLVTTEKDKKITSWSLENMPAILEEPYAPPLHELTTVVIFAPFDFQLGEYKGNMGNWQDFGKFIFTLKQGRDELPENVKKTIHQLVDGINDPKEKIQLLYSYMQQNTRYISIQLGIGGWQPFDAGYVAKKGYGDCKALTNYMYSILKEAGIRSCYTLIKAGRNSGYITEDFPSNEFNHVILSVPLQKDTVWLECTSQTLPAGYLGDFTNDRYALLIDENGGSLVRTPKYVMRDNLETRKVTAVLSDEASLHVQVVTNYRGLQQDNIHGLINYLSKDKVKEYLQKQLDFPTYNLDKFEYKQYKSILPEVEERLDLYVSNYATTTGKRLFIMPNVMTRSSSKLQLDDSRKCDIVLRSEYRDIDSVEIEIPKGYEPESFPQPVTIDTKFGRYYCSSKLVDNKIFYYRTREQFSGRFPAKDYTELVKFYDAIYKADRNKLVLLKKEGN